MFKELERNKFTPCPFSILHGRYALWTDNHISKKMLESHLNEDFEVSYSK